MDSLNGFVVFVQVAETRSFVAAGRLLGIDEVRAEVLPGDKAGHIARPLAAVKCSQGLAFQAQGAFHQIAVHGAVVHHQDRHAV